MKLWGPLWSILILALAACGGDETTDHSERPPPLAYVAAQCRDDAAGFVYGPETLQIRRGELDPVTVMEVPESTPLGIPGRCRQLGERRELPGVLSNFSGFNRLAVSPDGSAVVFEVNDEFNLAKHNLSAEQKQIFSVRADGSGLRALGPATHTGVGSFQGFRFNPDGRRVVFNDLGPDDAGHEVSQLWLLDIETGERTQVTHFSGAAEICCPRFVDSETIAFKRAGEAFTIRTSGEELIARPLPAAVPGARIDPTFFITGDQPAAVSFFFPDIPAVNPHDAFTVTREVFLADGANLLQLTNFHRVDTHNQLLGADGQRAFFVASTNQLGTNPDENCQLFSIDVTGADLRQLTSFSESQQSVRGCGSAAGFPKPLGCSLTRLFQDPVTRTVAFLSSCDPFGLNPYGVQLFSVRPDGTDLRQLTNLRGIFTDASNLFAAELISLYAYPGQGSAFQE